MPSRFGSVKTDENGNKKKLSKRDMGAKMDDYTALGESVQQNVLPILNALGIPGLGSSGGHHTINPDYDYDDEDPYDIYRNFDNTYDYDEDGDTGDDDDYAVWEYMNSLLFGDGDDDFDWDSYIGD